MATDASQTLEGIGVSSGVAIGPVVRMADPVRPPADEPSPSDVDEAVTRVRDALDVVATELDRRAALASSDAADILTATAMMARDPSLQASAERRLRDGSGPATAVDDAVEEVCASLEAVGGYLAERVTDLRDVRDRVVAHLLGAPQPGIPAVDRPSVLVAHDLAPADTAGLSRDEILAIVTEAGGPTSHTAILAAQMGLPAVVGIGAGRAELADGVVVAVDGGSGQVLVAPSEAAQADWRQRAEQRAARLSAFSGPGRTSDGVPVSLLANIGTVDDAKAAAEADVEGVGLFRTEFLYLDRSAAPTIAEQTDTYVAVLQAFGTRRVVVRTLDAGADKPLPFVQHGEEENPALGVRGLRLARRSTALLDDQLAALAAAAQQCEADVWVMAPMVATAEEAQWFAARARAAGLPKVGVMVEVPAAALRSGDVLADVDFASIGTNDLTQYTLAADRMLGELAPLLDAWQPSVLDLVAATVAGAGDTRSVGVCGEAAGDPLLALVLVGLGVTSLSMAPTKVPAVRAALALHDHARCAEIAAAARAATSAETARAAVVELLAPEARPLA
ncbi:phosphoenolpyruvate--protein phosphotransferase [Phytoactinopolyspora limicola]|uniref:phosphoenolpyruvate--protein phosphotransferase n=1 Tax=Phytoactinopolyspora limicola TaxID=2715536 RepID=UPI001408BA78|nr:phosphoenolpyruvate--protein phosphotransferase [Phytoactinopolyspora limicola]